MIDRGTLVVVGLAMAWPLGATLIVAMGRGGDVAPSRVFARAGVAAVVVAALLLTASLVMFATNGTTRSMAALGPQIGAGISLAGAVVCGAVALAIRLTRPDR